MFFCVLHLNTNILVFEYYKYIQQMQIQFDLFCFWPACNSVHVVQRDQYGNVLEISACETRIP